MNQKMTSLPPLLFPGKSRSERAELQALKKTRKVRQVGPRLYTSVAAKDISTTVRNHWAEIVANLFPDALLSHRSAIEYRPTDKGRIYLTGSTNREIVYPGLTLVFSRGHPRLPDDPPFSGFHAASLPRAFLENLSTRAGGQKSLSVATLEERLEEILKYQGEDKLIGLRDRAREISEEFGWGREYVKLDRIIGALLGTSPRHQLKSDIGRARAANVPYDAQALQRGQLLFAELRTFPFADVVDRFTAPDHFTNKAFFEAYFSNYIEGTTFEIEEAEEIVFDKKIPKNRPKDAHDIVGTYQLVSDPNVMRQLPQSGGDLIEILARRHAVLMKYRPEASPGELKTKPNRAGNTQFVAPEYVRGTLLKGFDLYRDLPPGMARAIFIMALIAEVHPFVDGNGRIARVMMNAELYAQGLVTVIIPNVFRDDYIGALRAFSRRERVQPLIKMLIQAQTFSAIEFSPYAATLRRLQARHWFAEPNDARIIL